MTAAYRAVAFAAASSACPPHHLHRHPARAPSCLRWAWTPFLLAAVVPTCLAVAEAALLPGGAAVQQRRGEIVGQLAVWQSVVQPQGLLVGRARLQPTGAADGQQQESTIAGAGSLESQCAVLQVKLEELLLHADTLPLELVEGTEKAREKERRQVAREDKILQQKQEHVSLYDVALASSFQGARHSSCCRGMHHAPAWALGRAACRLQVCTQPVYSGSKAPVCLVAVGGKSQACSGASSSPSVQKDGQARHGTQPAAEEESSASRNQAESGR